MKRNGFIRLPRLNRTQRIVCNLLASLLFLFLLWAVWGFPAPTTRLAAKWAAAAFGLPEPKILYEEAWQASYNRKDVVLGWKDGRLATVPCRRGRLYFREINSDFFFAEPENGAALLYTAEYVNLPYRNPVLYVWTDQTEAVRAEMDLRLRGVFHVGYTNQNYGISDEETYYDWDEIYTLTAEAAGNGVFPFKISPKYEDMPDSDDRPPGVHMRAMAEETSFWALQNLRNGRGDRDFSADVSVTFFDGAGNALRTWEKCLWPLEN